ncbi:ABC transporter ATP-binding protein [Tabrizicola soli]|uniref:ABC transporter ATP-binding protein n=2 Tax=Tabrizicola soli TaxID=2185115 RepID=A0ABV7DSK1_9RHOB|nr:ABC transporter ATP-binding protein [Tabrizicola soli]
MTPAAGIMQSRSGAAPAPEDAAVLSVRGLCVSVRTEAGLRPLVRDLSFSLRRGETLCIAGESGSGKSITSLAIMGLLPPPAVRVTGGSIRLHDTELTALPEARMRGIRGERVAMIFQEPMTSLNPVMTIGTQLAEAIRAHAQVGRAEARSRALAALRAVRLSQPERRMGQYPHELSGGMRQRVMIAMALALRPEVLIADEPTTALDVTVQREVLDLLRDLQRDTGMAIILITHDMGVVAEMADRVIVMRNGSMVEEAPVERLFSDPQADYTRDLLAAVPRMGQGAGRPAVADAPVARLSDVVVRFPLKGGLLGRTTHHVHAVEQVSFDIRRGETFALVGESGCGKSTIAKAMVGLVPHQGRIEVAGETLSAVDPGGMKQLRRRIQMVFQDPMAALDPRMTVGDQIAEPLVIHGIGDAAGRRARAADLMQRVGLTADQLARYPHEFSGGQRQRICIARALALQPDLIIADESVSALDVSVQARVLELLRTLQKEFGIAFLFISHDMAVVENISDRVAVMYLGQIVEMGTRAQIFGNPQHSYTRRLIQAVPVPDPGHRRPPGVRPTGDVPSPVHPAGSGPARVRLVDRGAGHMVAVED